MIWIQEEFTVTLIDPDGLQIPVPFTKGGETVMQWIPATAANRQFKNHLSCSI